MASTLPSPPPRRTVPWTPSPGVILEPNALRAATALDSNVAVPAGPGAGKTELLAQRANYLFTTGVCAYPMRIVAISFKVDAATNLRERVAARCRPEHARRFDSLTFHAFARHIVARHRPHVADRVPEDFRVGPGRSLKQIHYDDLLPLALEIVRKDPTAARVLRQSYAFAFFDEFQDCTAEQYDLLRLLFAQTPVLTTAVGDPKQRIMQFAGALEAALASYLGDFEAVELPIYQNHRSLPRLRRVQNALVKVMDPPAALPDTALASAFNVHGEAVYDGEVRVGGFADTAQEAAAVANKIRTAIAAGTRPDEIAVVVARNPGAYCEQLMDLLTTYGIACRNEQLHQDVLSEPAGQLILEFFRLVVLGTAPDEYVRLTDFMTRNCVDERQASRRRRSLDKFLEEVRTGLARGVLDLQDRNSVSEVLYRFLNVCRRQYLSLLATEYSDVEVLTEVAENAVSAVIDAVEESPTLKGAVARLSLEDAVRIINIHKCKGLEFEHVYVLGVEHEAFFDDLSIERSNFFVAISRAKTTLVLTYAMRRPTPSKPPWRWAINRTPQREFLGYAWPHESP